MDSKESEWRSPEGLGGWLILLLLEIWVTAAARLAAGLSSLAVIFHIAVPTAFAAPMAPFASAVAVAAGLFGGVTGFLLARKHLRGPVFAKALFSLDAGYSLLSLLAAVFHTGPVTAEPVQLWLRPSAYFIVSIVAIGYLLRSRRVANTYAPRPQGPNPAEVFAHDENSDVLRNRIFPWEEFGKPADPLSTDAQTPKPEASESPAPSTAEPDDETLLEPKHLSRIFRDAASAPLHSGLGIMAEDHHASIALPDRRRSDRRKPEEVWPTRRFAPEMPMAETPHARIFHDELPPSADPASPAPTEPRYPRHLRSSHPLQLDPGTREDAWPTPAFAPEAVRPAPHQSRIFSREMMLGTTTSLASAQNGNGHLPPHLGRPRIDRLPVESPWPPPASEEEPPEPATHPTEPHNPALQPTDPLARDAWPAGTFVAESSEDTALNGHQHPNGDPEFSAEEPYDPAADLRGEPVPQSFSPEPAPQAEAPPQPVEPEPLDLDTLKAQIAAGVTEWLDSAANNPSGPRIALFTETGDTLTPEEARQKLLDQVDAICDQVWSVCTGDSPTLPNSPDSGGSFENELRKWAVAQAAFRLSRSLDIRAAMEVNGPFERVAHDREYLMAVVLKNSSEDAFGRKVDLAEYDAHPGPEIAYRLILRAQREMFEADMWVHVATLAGDSDFTARFSSRGAKAYQDSREYWSGYANRLREDRAFPVPASPGLH
ncbi:MAG: hypothetical protein ACLGXA_14955 [Acidobacteriota bacterium]